MGFFNGSLGYKLILKHDEEAVSTRWNRPSFTWEEIDTDDQQGFLLEFAESAKREDILVSYVFWNIDDEQIQKYIVEKCGTLPPPTILKINKLTFLNISNREASPAVHTFGCGGIPWRDDRAKCWEDKIRPGDNFTFEVSPYLHNAGAIWSIIGQTAITTLAAVVTLGTSVPFTATASGIAGVSAAQGIALATAVSLASRSPVPVNTGGYQSCVG